MRPNRSQFPLEHCEITVKSSYCQSIIIDILIKCLRGWGWSITTQGATGFKATWR